MLLESCRSTMNELTDTVSSDTPKDGRVLLKSFLRVLIYGTSQLGSLKDTKDACKSFSGDHQTTLNDEAGKMK